MKNIQKGQCFCSYTVKISSFKGENKSSLAYFLRTHILSLISFFLKTFSPWISSHYCESDLWMSNQYIRIAGEMVY